MKKITVIFIAVMLMASCALLAGCYVSKPGSVSDFVGTYELSTYTRTPKSESADGSEENQPQPIDMLEQEGIQAYLIVNSDGTGYYVYKSNKVAPIARQIKLSYVYDEEDSSLLKEINYYSGVSTSGDGYPGKGEEKLGLTFGKTEQKLTYSMPAVFGRSYSQSVVYKHVSSAKDLSYASKKLGVELKAIDFELYNMNTVVSSDYYSEENEYIYFIINCNSADKKADIYYALKSDEQDVVLRDQPITIAKVDETLSKITIGSFEMFRNVWEGGTVLAPNIYSYYAATEESAERYVYYYNESRETTEIIEEIKTAYSDYLQSLEPQEDPIEE